MIRGARRDQKMIDFESASKKYNEEVLPTDCDSVRQSRWLLGDQPPGCIFKQSASFHEIHSSWQAQYLVMLEGNFCYSAQCK